MAEKRTKEEIEELLQRYRARGTIRRRAFCEREAVALPTLDHYLRRRAKPGVHLARVKIASEAATGRFALLLANGHRIECAATELTRLILAAEQA
ncbi:MAG: hypothetical protein H7Y20_02610 [Bryobacteraceae bacterium]|nr:hypothetical protein [Bryobacteraceae bacterium]